MVKRIITLVVTSSLISAGLLYLGFTILSQNTPAYASGSNALLVKTGVQDSSAPASVAGGSFTSKESESVKSESEISSPISAPSSSSAITSQPQTSTESTSAGSAPVLGLTIAELLKTTGLHDDVVVTLTGIAAVLDDERFILNDGTGQIMVEVEDDLLSSLKIDGLSVSVTGKFELSSDSTLAKLEATSLTFQGQTIVIEDGQDDDTDMDDDLDDDANDDDDVNDDDMDDDSNDDNSDSNEHEDEHDGVGGGSGEDSGSGSSHSASIGGDD